MHTHTQTCAHTHTHSDFEEWTDVDVNVDVMMDVNGKPHLSHRDDHRFLEKMNEQSLNLFCCCKMCINVYLTTTQI